jgi:hypothetical protein
MLKRALILSLATAAFASPAAPAPATTMKTLAGSTVASGSWSSGTLKSGTSSHFEGGAAGDVDCVSSTLGGTLGTNPFTPSVALGLTSLTFGGCTDTIPFVTVSGVTTNAGTGANVKTATATYVTPGTSSTFAIVGLAFTFTFSSGQTCIYEPLGGTATATHNSNTGNNEYAFNVTLTKTGGTFAFCPNPLTWTATYVLSSGGGGITIQP